MDILTKEERTKFGLFLAKTGSDRQNCIKICIFLPPCTISFLQVELERWLTVFKTTSTLKT